MVDGTVEIITGRERRRRWSVEDKLKIVSETLELGASVNQVAARHDVYPGLLFTWRRQMRSGKLAAQRKPLFFPVQTRDTATFRIICRSSHRGGNFPPSYEVEHRRRNKSVGSNICN